MTRSAGSQKVVYAALVGNLLVALTKFAAATISGSAAMLSEGVHSLVDSGNEVLLLYGLRQAAKQPTEQHPLGFGRELYFWSFVVSVVIFGLGSGFAIVEGLNHILHPAAVSHQGLTITVLVCSMVFEGGSWWVAFKSFRQVKGERGYIEAARESKDPTSFMVLFEDSAALIGLVIALASTIAGPALHAPYLDGAASLLIGLILAVTAAFLARESKALLIGEGADPRLSASILRLAATPDMHPNGVFTVHLGPDQVVAALSLEFADSLTAPRIEASVVDLEQRIRAQHPEVIALYVKPQTPATYRAKRGSLSDA